MSSRQPGDALRLDLAAALAALTDENLSFTETGPAHAGTHRIGPDQALQAVRQVGDLPVLGQLEEAQRPVHPFVDAVPGTSFSADYLRRTRPSAGSFAPADAVLSAHVGDWHTAIAAYAAW